MRTFVAVELDQACRSSLAAALDTLKNAVAGVRWVAPENAHLTLKFIGELAERDVPATVTAISSAASVAEPFRMRLKGISGFPPRGTPRVIHAPVEEQTGTLAPLAEGIDRALSDALGIKRETRSFKAHINYWVREYKRNCDVIDYPIG